MQVGAGQRWDFSSTVAKWVVPGLSGKQDVSISDLLRFVSVCRSGP